MPTSMPMYTTFFMPVADRPMMVAMSRKSGSSARNRLGMFLSSSTSMSSSVATKCSPRAWARLSENLMIRQLTAIAMMEPTIPMMGAAVSETPQPLAALIHAIAGTPGIIAMVNRAGAQCPRRAEQRPGNVALAEHRACQRDEREHGDEHRDARIGE